MGESKEERGREFECESGEEMKESAQATLGLVSQGEERKGEERKEEKKR